MEFDRKKIKTGMILERTDRAVGLGRLFVLVLGRQIGDDLYRTFQIKIVRGETRGDLVSYAFDHSITWKIIE